LIIKQREKHKEGAHAKKVIGRNAEAFDSMIKYPDSMFDKTHVNSLASMERMSKAADLHKSNRMRQTQMFSSCDDTKLAALNESAIHDVDKT
jgi:hypothetical protein